MAIADTGQEYIAAADAAERPSGLGFTGLFPVLRYRGLESDLAPLATYYGCDVQPWSAIAERGRAAAPRVASRPFFAGNAARSRHVLVAPSTNDHATIAALYAKASNKRLVLTPNVVDTAVGLISRGADSVVLLEAAERFTKSALRTIAERWSVRESEFGGVGIMTATDPGRISAFVCRLLLHRAFGTSGRRSALPSGTFVPVRSMTPLEYYVLAGHGSETHIDHGEHEVLIADTTAVPAGETVWPCTDPEHVPARLLPVHNLIVISCDLFTPTGGMAPRANSLFHELLAGWPSGIIASYKHAQVNDGFAILADCLLRAGYSLGEIASRLNSVASPGSEGDAAYLVLGDPEVRIFPERSGDPADSPVEKRGPDGIEVEARARGGRVIEWWMSPNDLSTLPAGRVAPNPLSNGLVERNTLFGFMPRPHTEQLGILIFRPADFPSEPHRFRLQACDALPPDDAREFAVRIRRLGLIGALGLDAGLMNQVQQRISSVFREAQAYPRPIEFLLGQRAARNALPLLGQALTEIRHQVLSALCNQIACERSWLSHRYRHEYARVRRKPGVGEGFKCPECDNRTTDWQCDDPIGEFESRTVRICDRCGIIADVPESPMIEIQVRTASLVDQVTYQQDFVVQNKMIEPLEVSLAAQFNRWEVAGITANPAVHDIVLDPGESQRIAIEFAFQRPLTPDLVSLHCFAMSERCELSAFTRRLVLAPGSALRAAGP